MDLGNEHLDELCHQYWTCLELEQHGQVTRLASQLVGRLVELLDEQLERCQEDQEDQEETDASAELALQVELVSCLCEELRYHSQAAAAYEHLSHFVRLNDWLALAEMVGAAPAAQGRIGAGQDTATQFDQLVGILRRAIHLLTFINQREQRSNGSESGSQNGGAREEESSPGQHLWIEPSLDTESMKSSGADFGTYTIQLEASGEPAGKPLAEHDIRWLIRRLDELSKRNDESTTIRNDSKLVHTLCRPAVRSILLQQCLVEGNQFGRFTIMVALWIVAIHAGHTSLEHLISELVDQIFHEETNSLDLDELLSLSQLGAFWLSHHKRFSANTKVRAGPHLDSTDLEDNQFDSCNSTSSSSPPLSDFPELQTSGNQQARLSLADQSLGAKLRRIIDDELLIGVACPACGHRPAEAHSAGELLLPVKRDYCTKCRHRHSAHRCAISFRPIQIIGLESLLAIAKQNTSQNERMSLIVVSAGEWARACLRANSKRLKLFAAPEGLGGEQIEVTEKFERLTVVRDEEWQCEDIISETEEQLSDSASEPPGQNEQYVKLLDTFMGQRCNRQKSNFSRQLVGSHERITFSQRASESLLMIGSIRGRKNLIKLPVCAVDLLQLDSTSTSANNFIRLCVAGTDDLADNQLWRCCMRSSISQVMLGCGRLYLALELVRSGQSMQSQFTCPTCEIHLIGCSPFHRPDPSNIFP